jgi:hypothetical protein
MKNYYVYALFPKEGPPNWIGYGKDARWVRPGPHTKDAALAELGSHAVFIKIAEGLTEGDAKELERNVIRSLGCRPDGPLLNRYLTGSFRKVISEEHRANLRLSAGKRVLTAALRKLYATAPKVWTGRKHRPSSREKMSKTKKGRPWSKARRLAYEQSR